MNSFLCFKSSSKKQENNNNNRTTTTTTTERRRQRRRQRQRQRQRYYATTQSNATHHFRSNQHALTGDALRRVIQVKGKWWKMCEFIKKQWKKGGSEREKGRDYTECWFALKQWCGSLLELTAKPCPFCRGCFLDVIWNLTQTRFAHVHFSGG